MTGFRRALIAGGVVAGLAGAYFAGAAINRPTPAGADQPGTARSQAPEAVTEINGVKLPAGLPPVGEGRPVAVENPTDVLTGAAPVPADALRPAPPAPPPAFVIPDLSKK